jgi:hypothetical protein
MHPIYKLLSVKNPHSIPFIICGSLFHTHNIQWTVRASSYWKQFTKQLCRHSRSRLNALQQTKTRKLQSILLVTMASGNYPESPSEWYNNEEPFQRAHPFRRHRRPENNLEAPDWTPSPNPFADSPPQSPIDLENSFRSERGPVPNNTPRTPRKFRGLTREDAEEYLQTYGWPGNQEHARAIDRVLNRGHKLPYELSESAIERMDQRIHSHRANQRFDASHTWTQPLGQSQRTQASQRLDPFSQTLGRSQAKRGHDIQVPASATPHGRLRSREAREAALTDSLNRLRATQTTPATPQIFSSGFGRPGFTSTQAVPDSHRTGGHPHIESGLPASQVPPGFDPDPLGLWRDRFLNDSFSQQTNPFAAKRNSHSDGTQDNNRVRDGRVKRPHGGLTGRKGLTGKASGSSAGNAGLPAGLDWANVPVPAFGRRSERSKREMESVIQSVLKRQHSRFMQETGQALDPLPENEATENFGLDDGQEGGHDPVDESLVEGIHFNLNAE